jgi:DNA-binding transcriptional LysR family regulator
VIAELEQALGVRFLDRGARGVEPTMYGRALLTRSNAAFDELRQSVRDIEFLADPTVGEVRIGCQTSHSTAEMPNDRLWVIRVDFGMSGACPVGR